MNDMDDVELFTKYYLEELNNIKDVKFRKFINNKLIEFRTCEDKNSFFNKYKLSIRERNLFTSVFVGIYNKIEEHKKSSTN